MTFSKRNIFLYFGKSPVQTSDFQSYIFGIKKYNSKNHFKTVVLGFGRGSGLNLEKAKIRNRLGTP